MPGGLQRAASARQSERQAIPCRHQSTRLAQTPSRAFKTICFVLNNKLNQGHAGGRLQKCRRPKPNIMLDLLVKRAVGCASAVVLAFLVHAECVPCGGTVNIVLGNVVHAHGDAQHGAHGDQVSTDVAIGDRAVVSTPSVHYFISCLERGTFLAITSRSEPCARPCVVCSLP